MSFYSNISKDICSVFVTATLISLSDYHQIPTLLIWYISFLDNCQQRVVCNSFEGQQKRITRGTTQGSVSGPYLFNIFINDLELVLGNQPALFKLKYADDSSIIVPIWSNGLSRTDLVEELLTWTNNNKMVCNPAKCKELVFRKSNYNDNIYRPNSQHSTM